MSSIKEPTTARNYDLFLKHKQYMDKKNYTECVQEWWAMYEGRQTPADYDPELPRATENICAWVVDSRQASIIGTTVVMNYQCFDKNMSTEELKKFDNYVQKAIKMDMYKDYACLDGLVSSAGILYHYWTDNFSFVRALNIGSLALDRIAIDDFFCSNPRLENDIQRQKYCGFRTREEVKNVRNTVSKNAKNYKDIIAQIVPDDYYESTDNYKDDVDVEAGLCSVITRFFRIDGEVYWTRSTKYVNLCDPTPLDPKSLGKKLVRKKVDENSYYPDSEEEWEIDGQVDEFQDESLEAQNNESYKREKDKMSLYPFAIYVPSPRRNCLYGRSDIESVFDNQILINFLISMTAKEIEDTAWATVIMKEGAANGQEWTGRPGGIFIDHTPGQGFGVKRLEGNQLNSQVMNYVSSIIDITKMVTGTNELIGNAQSVKDVTAYALQIMEEDKNKKIEVVQQRFWRFLKDCAEIRLQFYKHYYPETYYLYELSDAEYAEEMDKYNEMKANPNEPITLGDGTQTTYGDVVQQKGVPMRVQRKSINPREDLYGHFFDITVEAGKGSKYSEIIDMDLINNLFLNGGYEKMSADSFEMWLNLNSFMSESKKSDIKVLLNKQKQSELAQVKDQNMQLQDMLKTCLSRVKMLENRIKQSSLQNQELTKDFERRLGAASEIVKIKDQEIKQAKNDIPSAEEMAKED